MRKAIYWSKLKPVLAGEQAKQIIDPRNAFLMTSMMQDVVQRGTATKAKQLGRTDLAGKTGTTNNHVDAWFCGYQADLVAIAWIGFDNPKPLGNNETGGHAALPMWMSYMGKALKGVPVAAYTPPPASRQPKSIPKPVCGSRRYDDRIFLGGASYRPKRTIKQGGRGD